MLPNEIREKINNKEIFNLRKFILRKKTDANSLNIFSNLTSHELNTTHANEQKLQSQSQTTEVFPGDTIKR